MVTLDETMENGGALVILLMCWGLLPKLKVMRGIKSQVKRRIVLALSTPADHTNRA